MDEKRILITGKDSYIGNSVKNWLMKNEQSISIDEVCVKGETWREMNFSVYDAIFHVAGIAHSEIGNASEEAKALYYEVNTALTVEVAKKAKFEGVRQFIFMSSIIVYGTGMQFGKNQVIHRDSTPNPANFYGDSKLQAERNLNKLRAETFKIAIIRPPMVYGKGAKGNYPRLAKLARTFPFFPDIDNVRSMIHIDNLCEFARLLIKHVNDGTFHPQNEQYVDTSDLVVLIAEVHGKKMRLTKVFNPLLKILSKRVGLINKAFGNLYYDKKLSEYQENYCIRDFKESIELTEK